MGKVTLKTPYFGKSTEYRAKMKDEIGLARRKSEKRKTESGRLR